LGGLLGAVLPFNTKGIDFAMTAFFVVIFVEQWKSNKNHIPALTGLIGSAVCLIVFGASNFILPSMFVIVLVMTVFRKKLEPEMKG
jgi:4-azaleucine resistance transporter AzlC